MIRAIDQGYAAEQFACEYLQRQGLILLVERYRCRCGEIDLVMRDKETWVFVEVRSRKLAGFGNSQESVVYAKQQKLIKTAQHYLQCHGLTDKVPCRFDVVALNKVSKDNQVQVEWIKNAFEVIY